MTSPIVPTTGMGLYVHVPFCATKCPYCDFNTYQGIENLIDAYLQALTTELRLWGIGLEKPLVNTIFFGGGTPSYLPDGHILRMLETIRNSFEVGDDAEITVEANPDDLSGSKCAALFSQGVNRLSIGVQSLDDALLKMLGRRHDSGQAVQAVQEARTAGFTNISLDLMYGLPRQTMAQWQDTVLSLLSLEPTHLSFYCLTAEVGTPLHRWIQTGSVPEPDSDLAADMYDWAREELAGAGYHHYEISNWAKTVGNRVCEARHNVGYWRNSPYLGVGPGAHSCLGSYRFWEVDSPRSYIANVQHWGESGVRPLAPLTETMLKGIHQVAGWEHIVPELASSEAMILGLRLLDGMDLDEASIQVGQNLASLYSTEIKELKSLGLLEQNGSHLRLPESAYLIANQVFTRFVG